MTRNQPDQDYLEHVKSNIRKVMQNNNKAISITELQRRYQMLTRETIRLKELGFKKVVQLLLSIPDVVRLQGDKKNQVVAAPPVPKPKPAASSLTKRIPRVAPPGFDWNSSSTLFDVSTMNMSQMVDESTFNQSLQLSKKKSKGGQRDVEKKVSTPSKPVKPPKQDDVLHAGESLPPAVRHSEVIEMEVFELTVSEVHSPFRFWFHYGPEIKALDAMMGELNKAYLRLSEPTLAVPPNLIKPGFVAAVEFMQTWHRGVVVEAPTSTGVKVFFPDFGTISRVPAASVKYLLRKFATLPSCAHRGSLADILPTDGYWPPKATFIFLEAVKGNKTFFATCKRIRPVDGVYYLQLLDSNKLLDLNVNKLLVDYGFASLRAEHWPPKDYPHTMEVWPPFEDLEAGEFCSFNEVLQRLNAGWSVEEVYRPPWHLIDFGAIQKRLDEARDRYRQAEEAKMQALRLQRRRAVRSLKNANKDAQQSEVEIRDLPRKRYSTATLVVARSLKRISEDEEGQELGPGLKN